MNIHAKQSGFTIVELLIVIVVIGILAAITLVAFGGIRDRATEAGVKSDFSTLHKKLMVYRTDTGTWPAQNDTELNKVQYSASHSLYDTSVNNFLYCGSVASARYAIVALATNGKTYAQGSDLAFSEYTTHPLVNYSNICSDLIGSGSARYGHTTSDNWRQWARNAN